MAVKDMYIVQLKPDQTKSVLERIDEWGAQNRHQAVDITSHQPLHGVETRFLNRIPQQNKIL